jgi:hypothetical protein
LGHPARSGAKLAASGSVVYAACNSEGLQVIDATDPAHLQALAQPMSARYVESIRIAGNRAYVAVTDEILEDFWQPGELVELDVTNPARPSQTATRTTLGLAQDLAVDQDSILAALGLGATAAFHRESAGSVRVLGRIGTTGLSQSVQIADGLGYALDIYEGLRVISLDPTDWPAPHRLYLPVAASG